MTRWNQYSSKRLLGNVAAFALFYAYANAYPHLVTFALVPLIVFFSVALEKNKVQTLLMVVACSVLAIQIPPLVNGLTWHGIGFVAALGAMLGATLSHTLSEFNEKVR